MTVKMERGEDHGAADRFQRYLKLASLPLDSDLAMVDVGDLDRSRTNPSRSVFGGSSIHFHLVSRLQRKKLAW